jgi:hypothetical protein
MADDGQNPELMDAAWPEVARLFRNGAAFGPSPAWGFGLSARVGPERLGRLLRSRPARKLEAIVEGLSCDRLLHISQLARVNLEEARSGLRMTLVANVSVPLGFLLIINGTNPGWYAALASALPLPAILGALFVGLSMLLCIVLYSIAGVTAAQSLAHLMHLHLSARGCLAGHTDLLAPPEPDLPAEPPSG